MQLSHILASPGLQYEYPFSVTSETFGLNLSKLTQFNREIQEIPSEHSISNNVA